MNEGGVATLLFHLSFCIHGYRWFARLSVIQCCFWFLVLTVFLSQINMVGWCCSIRPYPSWWRHGACFLRCQILSENKPFCASVGSVLPTHICSFKFLHFPCAELNVENSILFSISIMEWKLFLSSLRYCSLMTVFSIVKLLCCCRHEPPVMSNHDVLILQKESNVVTICKPASIPVS